MGKHRGLGATRVGRTTCCVTSRNNKSSKGEMASKAKCKVLRDHLGSSPAGKGLTILRGHLQQEPAACSTSNQGQTRPKTAFLSQKATKLLSNGRQILLQGAAENWCVVSRHQEHFLCFIRGSEQVLERGKYPFTPAQGAGNS